MTEPRALAIVREYADLIAAIRARMDELELTFDILDHRSGVQVGYSAKILGPTPSKRFGPVSLGCILGALGLKLIAVDDPRAMEKYRSRMEKRRMAKPIPANASIPWQFTRLTGTKAQQLWMQKVSPERRREIARNAIRERWRRAVR